MSLLGGIGSALGGLFKDTPGGMSASDKLTLIGSALTDFGNGGSPEMTMQARKMISGNAEERQKKAAMEQLSQMLMGGGAQQQQPLSPQMPASPVMQGPGMDGGPVGVRPPIPQAAPAELPQRGPMTMNDPRMLPMAIAAMRAGVNLGPAMDVLKAQQPDVRYDRGFGYNGKTGDAMGGFHPDLDKGQTFSDGRVSNLPGAVGAASEMAAGTTGAQEQQKSLYDLIDIPQADGSTRKMTRFQAAQALSSGNAPQGLGVSQTPGAKAYQENAARSRADIEATNPKAQAAAQAQASVDLPKVRDQATQTLGVIDALLKNPEMKHRTGAFSVLPAIPGTAGAGFDALHDQLTGQIFMQAYTTLKGGGQITEVEGKKATAALARLSRAQSPEDYSRGLQELRDVISKGLQRAEGQAGGSRPGGSQQATPASFSRSAIEAEMRRRGLLH